MSLLSLNRDELKLIFRELEPEAVVRLCNSSKRLRDFCNRYNMWRFATGEFSKLDGNTLALIQLDAEPYQVVMFCNLNAGFRRICNKSGFWQTMLRQHYPKITPSSNTIELNRQLYLENTTITFLLHADIYGDNPGHQDHYGRVFNSLEYFGLLDQIQEATLVPNGDWDDQGDVTLKLSAIYWDYETVWVAARSDWNGIEVEAFDTKANAIQAFIDSGDVDFLSKYFEERLVSSDEADPNLYFNLYLSDIGLAGGLDEGEARITLTKQAVWDRVFQAGYPQLVADETWQQAEQRVYDYIDRNGFFLRGVDFSDPTHDPANITSFQVFQVRLIKNIDPRLELYQF